MIKRPLHPRFSQAVLEERKFTTIREKPWPIGVPIMLFNWAGKAYRSKHLNITAVIASGFWTIHIEHGADGTMHYTYGMEHKQPLHQTEGFESQADMDDWFRKLVPPGHTITQHLMRFRLHKD